MPSWFEFLRIEAELAMTFIDTARVYASPANSARALGNARTALAEIQRSLMRPMIRGLSENEVWFLERRCLEIELALTMV